MKTFKYFNEVAQDALNPLFPYGGSSYGPGMGQYEPIADLNAQKKFLGQVKSLNLKGDTKEIKKSDLDQLERYADKIFGVLGIDVEFTRHFLDRVNDIRNQRQITYAELIRLFKQSFKKYGKKIAKLGDDAEAVISDMKTDINMPFVLNKNRRGELELVAKTIMRKKNFSTSNTKMSFENYIKEMKFFTDDVVDQITLPNPPTDDVSEILKLKKMMRARTPEDVQSVKDHDEVSFYAIKKYCDENGLKFHDGEFKDITQQCRPAIAYFKNKFDRRRPKEVDNTIKTLNSKTTNTRSYPSGHSAQSMLVAKYVIGKFPKHEKGLLEAAKECGIGRVLAGFHYLSDHVAGKLLGEKLYMLMNKDDYNA